MDFFVSWYPGDAYYPLYDEDCSLLVSITSVSQEWTIRSLPKLPRRLLIDSGGFHLASTAQIPRQLLTSPMSGSTVRMYGEDVDTQEEDLFHILPKKVLDRQFALLESCDLPTIVCSLDYPILDADLGWQKREMHITQTIASAYELKSLIAQQEREHRATPLAVVQGYDRDSLQ